MLDQSEVGQRVVVRSHVDRAGGGSALRDTVGVLMSVDADGVVVRGRSGLIRLASADIALARVVAPATRDILAVQRIAALGWRAAETAEVDGWQLRADHGFTRRANSAMPLTGATRPLPELLAALAAWYRDRDLPALIQVPLPARRLLDAELDRLGWTAEGRSVVLTRDLDLDLDCAGRPEVVLSPAPSAGWLAALGDLPRQAHELLTRHPAASFAAVAVHDDLVAVARGAVDEHWLGITNLRVAPAHRRGGLGSALTAALSRWAGGQGLADRCYLQVEADNHGALELYRSLGFIPHHRYHYRRAPAAKA